MTRYRWVVIAIIFVFYTVTYADRANIGVVLPRIQSEFHLSNFEAGSLASLFFAGYALTQIPAGLWYGRFGVRGLISLAMVVTSVFTGLIGTSGSAAMIKLYRFGLGMAEGPGGPGVASTINNWFPAKEKGTATGIFIAATKFAPVLVPPITVWIMLAFGWRQVFYFFALPGFVMAAVWHLFVRNYPQESPFCSPAEVGYIKETTGAEKTAATEPTRSLGWLDTLIRARKVPLLTTNREVFTSWNMWANTIGLFMVISVIYGLLTWIPSYLVKAKHFTFMQMGFVASTPWVGAVLGCFVGGIISDKVLAKRRKPLMLLGAIATMGMMVALIAAPADKTVIALLLLLTGFVLSLGYPLYTAYPMGLATAKTFPVASSLVNSGGNLGGFFAPMLAGYLLDKFGYSGVFTYFGVCSALCVVVIMTMEEPI
jgi:sugar phosphate permease